MCLLAKEGTLCLKEDMCEKNLTNFISMTKLSFG